MSMVAKKQSAAPRLEASRAAPRGVQASRAAPAGPQGRDAFTLVELLVVIGILAILAALITPAIFQARVSARNAAIKAEIDMLHMAIMNYKNEYGSFPPCYDTNTTLSGNGPAVKHLRRLFPRCSTIDAQFSSSGLQPANMVHPANALNFWLRGYTGDLESPLNPPLSRKKLYDFDDYRVDANGMYLAPNAQGTPYLYFDSSRYLNVNGQAGTGLGKCPAVFRVWRNDGPTGSGQFLELDGFIILSAGIDGEFYTADDISNAWKGTWEEWSERLQ